jgi:nitrogen regulatory protein P-II 1
METRQVVAFIRREKLEDVERRLRELGIKRINVCKVKGYGEYHDFFARDWMVDEVRVDVFARQEYVEEIVQAILETAHTGLPGDGVVAVIPVEKFYLIRTRKEATREEFWPPADSDAASI